jgi:hypothetical protein
MDAPEFRIAVGLVGCFVTCRLKAVIVLVWQGYLFARAMSHWSTASRLVSSLALMP